MTFAEKPQKSIFLFEISVLMDGKKNKNIYLRQEEILVK